MAGTPIEIQFSQNELRFTYARSSGAGGQNVNKVNSKAVLHWNPSQSQAMPEGVRDRFMKRYGSKLNADGDMIIMSERHRDQGRNAADCMDKLREMIRSVWFPPKKRKATKPTYGSKQRRLKAKKEHSEKKTNRRWKDD